MCVKVNSSSSINALYVISEPPYFLVVPENSNIVKRGFIILGCQATSPGGEETRLQWYREGTLLPVRGEKHLKLRNGSLLLSNVYPAQAGNYCCQASNRHGRSLACAKVTVFSKYIFFSFLFFRLEVAVLPTLCYTLGLVFYW